MDPLHPITPTTPGITGPVAPASAARIQPDAERRRQQAREEQARQEQARQERRRREQRGGAYADMDVRDDDEDGGEPRPRIDVTA